MIVFFLIYFATVVWGVKVKEPRSVNYMDMDHTQAVKGIFILLVFFSHFNAQVEFTSALDIVYKKAVSFFGQMMVTMFLFYSGYGVMESIKRKGLLYIDGIPAKRILPTLIRFDCAVVIYAILGLILGQYYRPITYLLALTGWESVGNSNWYIFDILAFYLLTYVTFKIAYSKNKQNDLLAVFLIFIVVCFAIIILTRYHIKDTWWYDTLLCYVLGMFFSLLRERIEHLLNHNWLIWIGALVSSWALLLLLKMNQINIWFIMARNVAFCVAFTILTMRVHFQNRVLIWCGKNLFEIYILQRIPMILLKSLSVDQISIYLYFVGCVGITLVLIFPFKHITSLAVKIPWMFHKKESV